MIEFDKYITDHLANARAAALTNDLRMAYHHAYRAMQELLHSAQWQRASDELDEMCSTKYPVEFGLGVIRFSHGGSSRIPKWDLIIDKLKETVIAQGKDAKILMRGLINE